MMRGENKAPRAIILEWMSLPREQRRTEAQAAAFGRRASEKHDFRCAGDRQRTIMVWLTPRIGRS